MNIFSEKKSAYIICAALLILGVFLVIYDKDNDKKTDTDDGLTVAVGYKSELERTCASMCVSFSDVRSAQVNITLEGTMKSVYAKNSEGSYGGTYFSSGGDPLLLKYDFPSIIGCAVICKGSESDTLRLELTNMLSAYLGIPSNKIYIGFS